MPDSITNFFKDNSRWLITLLFAAGFLYAEFKYLVRDFDSEKILLRKETNDVELRLDKKIKIINSLEAENDAQNIRISLLEIQIKSLNNN